MDTTPQSSCRVAPDVKLGQGVTMHAFVNLYGCEIGDNTRLGYHLPVPLPDFERLRERDGRPPWFCPRRLSTSRSSSRR